MQIGKRTGGCSLSWGGKTYSWAKDGAVTQVPRELADDLLSIRGADFFRPEDEPEPVKVTEPAPARAEVTEPAPPPAKAVTEAKPDAK